MAAAEEPSPEVHPGPTAATRLVLGLGNPGEEYRSTRHNVGFRVVEELARRRGLAFTGAECRSRLAEGDDLLLVQPQTYMNRSGYALRCLLERRELEPEAVLVVYDDVHLPLGRLRLRPGGSPGGHRGMESVIGNLRTDAVPRLRLGVGEADGPPEGGDELVDHVLGAFEEEEEAAAEAMVLRGADACETWLSAGSEAAMQRHNGPPPEES